MYIYSRRNRYRIMKNNIHAVRIKKKDKKLYNKRLHIVVDSDLYNKVVEIVKDEQNIYNTKDLFLYSAISDKLQRCLNGLDKRHNAGEIHLKEVKKLEE